MYNPHSGRELYIPHISQTSHFHSFWDKNLRKSTTWIIRKYFTQRIWINNRSHAQLSVVRSCSRFSLPVYCLPSPHPLLLLTTPHPPAVSPPPENTLKQFRRTENWAWASVINPYSLISPEYWPGLHSMRSYCATCSPVPVVSENKSCSQTRNYTPAGLK